MTWVAGTILGALEVGPGDPSDITAILGHPQDREALIQRDPSLASRDLTEYLCRNIDVGRVEYWSKQLAGDLAAGGAKVVIAGTPEYPAMLAKSWDAPPLLFVRGQISTARAVAIIGSRDTDHAVLSAAHSVAGVLAGEGYSIVSGLAAGVDTAAHHGALDVGGHTVAVMGTGIRHVYPASNASLCERIAHSGAVISQFPPDAPRTGTTFLRRNQVIAGLARASLVMAGQERSGSRHEIEQAISAGRTAILWRPGLAEQAWAVDLDRRGLAQFVDDVDGILRLLEETS
ncbi:MAG TPA: DNA-processing protein DprA [Nakamurella sp.]